MKKSCPWCGRIVDRRHVCPKKPRKYSKRFTEKDSFRGSWSWKMKRKEIRDRDKNVCVFCLSKGRITIDKISVHHIVPLEEDNELALEDSNLITLCDACHERAEKGLIKREVLQRLIPPGC